MCGNLFAVQSFGRVARSAPPLETVGAARRPYHGRMARRGLMCISGLSRCLAFVFGASVRAPFLEN
eukprot:6480211-Lingulodinium_polyedra.AAC.1